MIQEEISLDEFIRRKKMNDQFSLLNHRRRDRQDITQDDLDNSLDQYVRDARAESQGSSSASSPQQNFKNSTKNGKFDRKSMRSDDSESEDDECNKTLVPDEDIVMADLENQEKEDHLEDLFQFQTVESRYGIRVRSQQWRMLPENLVDRPEGVQRLECLPLDDDERYKRVQNGKVTKNNRSRTSSFSSNNSKGSYTGNSGNYGGNKKNNRNLTAEGIRAQGNFVEKGSFTYKTGDRNGDGNVGIIGIERAKRINPPEVGQEVQVKGGQQGNVSQQGNAPQININMNWEGFWEGAKDKKQESVRQESCDDMLNLAAINILKLLKDKRNNDIEKERMQSEIAEIQGRPLQTSGAVDTNPQNAVSMYRRYV